MALECVAPSKAAVHSDRQLQNTPNLARTSISPKTYELPPNVWLHDLWCVGLVQDCETIRDANGTPACCAYLCGAECRHFQQGGSSSSVRGADPTDRPPRRNAGASSKRYRKPCDRSHDLEQSIIEEFRKANEEKLRLAAALSEEREKARKLREEQEKEALLKPEDPPDWLSEHRSELIQNYDASKYSFQELVAAILECESEVDHNDAMTLYSSLEQLHTDRAYQWQSRMMPNHTCDNDRTQAQPPAVSETEGGRKVPLNPKLIHAYKSAGRQIPEEWKKACMREKRLFLKLQKDSRWIQFLQAFEAFCREELLPLTCGPSETHHHGIVVQYPPTLRIHMPGRAASIKMHVDTDYPCHSDAEVNFWVPLTRAFGNNTLWAESEPEKGDFRPFELNPGQFVRFEGVKCRHFTKANDTDLTRVSFDLRAVPGCIWRDLHKGRIGDFGCKLILPKKDSQTNVCEKLSLD